MADVVAAQVDDHGAGLISYTPRDLPMISFMISVVPAERAPVAGTLDDDAPLLVRNTRQREWEDLSDSLGAS